MEILQNFVENLINVLRFLVAFVICVSSSCGPLLLAAWNRSVWWLLLLIIGVPAFITTLDWYHHEL